MPEEPTRVAVVGAGAWGTALATVLATSRHDVLVWAREPEVVADINERRENRTFLPGVRLPANVRATGDLVEAVRSRAFVFSVCPAQHTRQLTALWAPHATDDVVIVSASKGIELETNRLMSEVFDEVLPPRLRTRVCFLSGPSFAREVGEGRPTAVVVAARDEALAERVQHLVAHPTFRVYRSTDVVGVEVAGALKNVIAIATGVCDGMALGHNARAALITRGLAEITRLAVRLGANPVTLMGLAGMGDLVLTCTADLSRNRTVGLALGRGERLADVLAGKPQVAEGVTTARAAYALARRLGVDTPLIDEVYALVHEGRPLAGVVERLMTRALKREEI